MLDNGSRDGSAEAARAHPAVDEVIALDERRGKALNDSELLRRARGRYALLLNEDSELLPGATRALWQALEARPQAACAGARLLRPDGSRAGVRVALSRARSTALAGALLLHRALTVQSRGARTREVDWCQSAALLVRRAAAEQVGYLDPDFFVYSDEVDFARRLRDRRLGSAVRARRRGDPPRAARRPARCRERRIVEMARNRDLYMRKHHSAGAARAVRWLTAWPYALRALAAARRCPATRRAALLAARRARRSRPARGEGLREAAERYNARATETGSAHRQTSRSGSSA